MQSYIHTYVLPALTAARMPASAPPACARITPLLDSDVGSVGVDAGEAPDDDDNSASTVVCGGTTMPADEVIALPVTPLTLDALTGTIVLAATTPGADVLTPLLAIAPLARRVELRRARLRR
jgi:hypothetical protein